MASPITQDTTSDTTSIALTTQQGFFDRLFGRIYDAFMARSLYRMAPTSKLGNRMNGR